MRRSTAGATSTRSASSPTRCSPAPAVPGRNRVVVSKHIAERPAPIERVRPDSPRPLAGAIMRALEKQPADRWQTGEEFRQASLGERARRPRRRNRRAAAAGRRRRGARGAGRAVGLARRSDRSARGGQSRGIRSWCYPSTTCATTAPWTGCATAASACWGSTCRSGTTSRSWTTSGCTISWPATSSRPADDIGLDLARRLAREAGVWTVVLGDFAQAGDSLHLTARVYDVASGDRVDVARVDDRAGADVRPLFDELAARLLDLSGRAERGAASASPGPPAVARGLPRLPGGRGAAQPLGSGRRGARSQPRDPIDTTFGLAYYKLALTRGWLVGTGDSIADAAIVRATAYSANLPAHDRTVINAYRAFLGGEFAEARGPRTSSSSPATRPTPTPGTASARRGSTTPPAPTRRRPGPRPSGPSSARWRSIPTMRWPTSTCRRCWAPRRRRSPTTRW